MPQRPRLGTVEPTVLAPNSILNDEYQPIEPDTETETTPWSAAWEASKQRNWTNDNLTNKLEAERAGGYDPSFVAPVKDINALSAQKLYTDTEREYLLESTSKDNFSARIGKVDADREKLKTVRAAGPWLGAGAEIAAQMTDPVMLPFMFLRVPKAVFGISKAGVLAARLTENAALVAAQEAILKQGDTQRSNDDIMRAAVSAVVLTGVVHGGVGLGKRLWSKPDIDVATKIDDIHEAGVNEPLIGKAYNNADDILSDVIPDKQARSRVLLERDILDRLKSEAGEASDVLSTSKLRKIKDEFNLYKANRLEVIDKIKARPNVRPSAVAKEVAQVQAAISRKQLELDALINKNQMARDVKSIHSSLQQGVLPEKLQARYTKLREEMGIFDIKQPKIIHPDVVTPTEPVQVVQAVADKQSIGAAKVETVAPDIHSKYELLTTEYPEKVRESVNRADALGKSFPRTSALRNATLTAPLRSLSSTLDTAASDATRGLAKMLFKDPIVTVRGHQSAAEIAETVFGRFKPFAMEYKTALDRYLNEQGVSRWSSKKVQQASDEFDREVTLYQASGNLLSNTPVAGDTAVILGAKARSKIYEMGLKLNKDSNVVGWDKISHRHEYVPIVFTSDNLLSVASRNEQQYIRDCFAMAYQTGGIKLSRDNALKLADTQIQRVFDKTGGNKSFPQKMTGGDFNNIAKELREKGVDDDAIEELKGSLFGGLEMANISPRAMFSLRPNIKARSGDVWLVDLLDTSMDRALRYAADASGNTGLAAHGFHSRSQFISAVHAARDAEAETLTTRIQDLSGPEGVKAKDAAIDMLKRVNTAEDAKALEQGLSLLYREPIEDTTPLSSFMNLSSQLVGIVRLGMSGLMSLPEYGTVAAMNGVRKTLSQLPMGRFFNLSKKSIQQDEFMNKLAKAHGAVGHQNYMFGRQFFRNSEFTDEVTSRLQSIHKLFGGMLDVTLTLSLFRSIQHGGEEVAARTMIAELDSFAKTGVISKDLQHTLIDSGALSEETLDEFLSAARGGPSADHFDLVNQLSPKAHNELSTAIQSSLSHQMLRPILGEQPRYRNSSVGRFATSLMGFSITSYEKLLYRGVSQERALFMVKAMYNLALGGASYYAYVYTRANKYNGNERDEYIEKALSSEGLFWGMINRFGPLSGPMLYANALKTTGATELLKPPLRAVGVEDDFVDKMQGLTGLPQVELGRDMYKASRSAFSMAANEQTQEEHDRDVKAMKDILPWYNSALFNLTFGAVDNE